MLFNGDGVGTGNWKQTGPNIYMEINNKFSVREGSVNGNTMSGTGFNQKGATWNWTYQLNASNASSKPSSQTSAPPPPVPQTQNAPLTISDAICENWKSILVGQTLEFRNIGIPVGQAVDTVNSESDTNTRIFLKKVVRQIYADPAQGKSYLESGRFQKECVSIHRGY